MHSELWSLVVSGAALGLWAGVAPGPLLTLVVTETLRHGPRAGAKVAVAPLITDFPIIAVCVFALSGLAMVSGLLGGMSLAGGAVLFWMAWDTMTASPPDASVEVKADRSLQKGVLTNFLNPHPYLFWITVGGPLLFSAHEKSGVLGPALFLAAFYLLLVASKLVVALAAGRSRSFLGGAAYRWLLRGMAVMLAVFGALFFREGLRLLQL